MEQAIHILHVDIHRDAAYDDRDGQVEMLPHVLLNTAAELREEEVVVLIQLAERCAYIAIEQVDGADRIAVGAVEVIDLRSLEAAQPLNLHVFLNPLACVHVTLRGPDQKFRGHHLGRFRPLRVASSGVLVVDWVETDSGDRVEELF